VSHHAASSTTSATDFNPDPDLDLDLDLDDDDKQLRHHHHHSAAGSYDDTCQAVPYRHPHDATRRLRAHPLPDPQLHE
jgi:hypothetical protein